MLALLLCQPRGHLQLINEAGISLYVLPPHRSGGWWPTRLEVVCRFCYPPYHKNYVYSDREGIFVEIKKSTHDFSFRLATGDSSSKTLRKIYVIFAKLSKSPRQEFQVRKPEIEFWKNYYHRRIRWRVIYWNVVWEAVSQGREMKCAISIDGKMEVLFTRTWV